MTVMSSLVKHERLTVAYCAIRIKYYSLASPGSRERPADFYCKRSAELPQFSPGPGHCVIE
jgi:hypothetical protein